MKLFVEIDLFSEETFKHFINHQKMQLEDFGLRSYEARHLSTIISDLDSWLTIANDSIQIFPDSFQRFGSEYISNFIRQLESDVRRESQRMSFAAQFQ
jgi:hypothetical protein